MLERVPKVISVFDQFGLLKSLAKASADGKANCISVLFKKFNIDPSEGSKQMEFQIVTKES